MTRVTNFGRKRTYVQAGLNDESKVVEDTQPPAAEHAGTEQVTGAAADSQPPPKKKRKRTKMSKRDGNASKEGTSGGSGVAVVVSEGSGAQKTRDCEGVVDADAAEKKRAKKKAKAQQAKDKKQQRMLESERRRLKRIQDKNINTTCFACREKGHAAKDCPKNAPVEGDEKGKSKELLGICYRCGSRKHTLSRCKKLTDPDNPLPYASCFVCDGKGHLASSCPQNKDKGLYPNGGCCKLCGDNTHMAKDCGIRKQDMVNTATFLGTGAGAGADEDDFHTFKRRYTEVEKDEKREDKAKRMLGVTVGTHSRVVKALAAATPVQSKKNVVFF